MHASDELDRTHLPT